LSRLPAALRGALWMVGALLSFSLMAVSVRELLRTMGSFEILFLRSLVSFVLVLAALPRFGTESLRTQRFGLHVVRNVLHFGGQYAWVYAIAMLPLATVFAIEFTMPVWAAVLAMLVLGERLNRGRTVMLVLGLACILIDFLRLPLIAAVGMLFYGESLEMPILLGAAVIFAGTYYSIRRESRKPGTDHGL